MKHTTLILAVVLALLARDLLTPARAEPLPALDRADVQRIAKALEAQVQATREVARATERCAR